MRQVFVILICLAVLSIAGCGGGDEADQGGPGGAGGGGGGAGGGSGAIANFCNGLTADDSSTSMSVRIGSEPSVVTLGPVLTGHCSNENEVDQMCSAIPAGDDIEFALWFADGSTTLCTGTFDQIPEGSQVLILTIVNSGNQPCIEAGTLIEGVTCEEVDPFE